MVSRADHGETVLTVFFQERPLHNPTGLSAIPLDINNDGVIVARHGPTGSSGIYYIRPLIVETASGVQFDWFVDNDSDDVNDLGTELVDGTSSGRYDINNRGQVLGTTLAHGDFDIGYWEDENAIPVSISREVHDYIAAEVTEGATIQATSFNIRRIDGNAFFLNDKGDITINPPTGPCLIYRGDAVIWPGGDPVFDAGTGSLTFPNQCDIGALNNEGESIGLLVESGVSQQVMWNAGGQAFIPLNTQSLTGALGSTGQNGNFNDITMTWGVSVVTSLIRHPAIRNGDALTIITPSDFGLLDGKAAVASVNKFGEAVGRIDEPRDPSRWSYPFLYLPKAAYGLDAGLYNLAELTGALEASNFFSVPDQTEYQPLQINDNGYITVRKNETTDAFHEEYVVLRPFHREGARAEPLRPFTSTDFRYAETDADPVNTFTGEFVHSEDNDLTAGRLHFARSYGSANHENGLDDPTLGRNWNHNFSWGQLSRNIDSTSGVGNASIKAPDGTLYRFTLNAAQFLVDGSELWSPVAPAGSTAELRQTGTGHLLLARLPDRVINLDNSGVVNEISDTLGYVQFLSYDSAGRLLSVSDSDNRQLNFSYGSGSELIGVADSEGRSVTLSYDIFGDLIRFSNGIGNESSYSYDSNGLMLNKTQPLGNVHTTQYYDDFRRVERQVAGNGDTTTFQYDSLLLQTNVADPTGTRSYRYDTDGKLLLKIDNQGRQRNYSYDGAQQRDTLQFNGRTTDIAFDGISGMPETVTQPDGSQYVHSYISRLVDGFTLHQRNAIQYPNGTAIQIFYGSNGRVNRFVDEEGYEQLFTYNTAGLLTNYTNELGGVYTLQYDSLGRLTSQTTPQGTVVTHAYSGKQFNNDLQTDVYQHTTTYADGSTHVALFDEAGQLRMRINPSVHQYVYFYDANGNRNRITDFGINPRLFAYDALDRLTRITDAESGVTQYDYDLWNRIVQVTDPNNLVRSLNYDGNGNTVAVTDASGFDWTFGYSPEGLQTSVTDPAGNTRRRTYNALGHVSSEMDALGNTTTFSRDAMGRMLSSMNALGATTSFDYDQRGLLEGIHLPGNIDASYTLNGLGQITQFTDPNGNNSAFSFDNEGRLTAMQDPLGRQTGFGYDSRGRLSRVDYPDGSHVIVTARNTNRVAARSHFAANGDAGYVNFFNHDANGRIVVANAVTLAYDGNGRVIDANGVDTTRDAGGRITRISYGAGKDIDYSYSDDRLTRISDWTGAEINFTYDNVGRVNGISRSNGVATAVSHDANGSIIGITETHGAAQLASLSLSYNAAGLLVAAQDNYPAALTFAASSTSRTVDAANQISAFSYDPLGRVTDDGDRTYPLWFGPDNLGEMHRDGLVIFFDADAFGNRINREVIGGINTDFTWNFSTDLPSPVIETEDNSVKYYYVYSTQGHLLYRINANDNSRQFYHFDDNGNTRFITSDNGAVVASYAYLPYGEMISSAGLTDNWFTFNGRFGVIREPDTSLYHMRRRVYDSATQRFLTPEPVQRFDDPRTLNSYQFALGNPRQFIDPSGESAEPTAGSGNAFDQTVAAVNEIRGDAAGHLIKFAELTEQDHLADAGRVLEGDFGENANTVIGAGKEIYKTAGKLDDVFDATLSCQELAQKTYDQQIRKQLDDFKTGELLPEEFELLIPLNEQNFAAARELCERTGWIDTAIAALEGIENVLTGLTPDRVQEGIAAAKEAAQASGVENPLVIRDY